MDTKQKILLGAFRALRSEGLPVISYDRVAESADVSRQLVRYHFKDPDDLMVALCDHLAGLYRDLLVEKAKALQGAARIEMFMDFYFGLLDDAPKPADDQVYDALLSRAAGSPPVRERLRSQYSLLGQVVGHELQLAFPELERRAADELSFIFVSLMYGHWKMVASLGVSRAHNQVTRAAMRRLIQSYVNGGALTREGFALWAPDP